MQFMWVFHLQFPVPYLNILVNVRISPFVYLVGMLKQFWKAWMRIQKNAYNSSLIP